MNLKILIILVILSAFLQSFFGFSIFGVKPNLALVVVVAASFFVAGILEGFLLAALAALILKFAPAAGTEILAFSLIAAGAVIVKNHLPWRNFLNFLFLIIAGTLSFYFFLSPKLIVSFLFAKELFLNAFFGILVFAFLSFLRQNKLI
jgi:hypothetical protein